MQQLLSHPSPMTFRRLTSLGSESKHIRKICTSSVIETCCIFYFTCKNNIYPYYYMVVTEKNFKTTIAASTVQANILVLCWGSNANINATSFRTLFHDRRNLITNYALFFVVVPEVFSCLKSAFYEPLALFQS